MPVKRLPAPPSLVHLKHQAKELLKARGTQDASVAQRIREFHPRFTESTDLQIFAAPLRLSDAQLVISREYGFPSWTRLKKRIEKPTRADDLSLPVHKRIEDAHFRRAVVLLDAGNEDALRAHLRQHPEIIRQRVTFDGQNYFRNPTLLEFVAENPVRHGTLSPNIVELTKLILESGAKQDPAAINETLGLVSSGRVARECQVQIPLIDLLCDYGADPQQAMSPALAHGEFEAVNALLQRSAPLDLTAAAALGSVDDASRLLPSANTEQRHRALALSAQFGRSAIIRLLLDADQNPNQYNPPGFHSHSTPLHQAALAGHLEVVKLLVERGARLDIRDTLWQGTPADWAQHGSMTQVEQYLRLQSEHLND